MVSSYRKLRNGPHPPPVAIARCPYPRFLPKQALIRVLPEIEHNNHATIYKGSVQDSNLLGPYLRGCSAIFMVLSSNVNEPRFRAGQDADTAVIKVRRDLHPAAPSKIILLSSAALEDSLSRKTLSLLRQVLHLSASHVYRDLVETEKLLRAEQDWLKTLFVKPGALSVDKQRGRGLYSVELDNLVSHLDSAAAMIQVADDTTGSYNMKNVGVINAKRRCQISHGNTIVYQVSRDVLIGDTNEVITPRGMKDIGHFSGVTGRDVGLDQHERVGVSEAAGSAFLSVSIFVASRKAKPA
ncbi:hypothetical protein E4U53_001093 [Claviceps sorghi]|nr:hypothetical protein E4U53_001093 [Claviceps sorghi]